MAETFIGGYHKFSLCIGEGAGLNLAFNEFTADFGDGYDAQALFGSKLGLRNWSVPLPVLADFTADAIHTFRGKDYTRAGYIANLFQWQKNSGIPFVVQDPRTNNYYLAKFAESQQTLTRKLTAMYETSIQLKQVRKTGVSVFDISAVPEVNGLYRSLSFAEDHADNDAIDETWIDESGAGNHIGSTLGTYQTNEQNSLPVVRLNGTSDFIQSNDPVTVYNAFFIAKYRGASFSNYAGLLTGAANGGGSALVGNSGDTKFFNFSFGSSYEYYKNGIKYAENNQQAPMNVFGLIAARWQNGVSLDCIQIGKDRSQVGRFGAWDLGEIVLSTTLIGEEAFWEITEDLMKRWDIH